MGLVDETEKLFGEVIEQDRWALSFRSAREVTRIVLDSRTVPHLLQHLQIVLGSSP